MKRFAFFIAVFLPLSFSAFSQQGVSDTASQNAYTRTINQRAEKITGTLGIRDAKKSATVTQVIAGQYRNLSAIQTERDTRIKQVKLQLQDDKAAQAASVKKAEEEATRRTDSLHATFLTALSANLSKDQVVKVKDGLTYNVLPITYKGYQDMILNLTDAQKKQIMDWLVEAREHAMDAESSDKKHAWFGKYKGRINNYLSAAGYDLKKEGDEWTKRRKAAETTKGNE